MLKVERQQYQFQIIPEDQMVLLILEMVDHLVAVLLLVVVMVDLVSL